MTKEQIRVRQSYADVDEGAEDFGFCDQKGRAVGFKWAISTVTATPIPEDEKVGSCWLWPADVPLTRLEVWGTPTRNGKSYGATSPSLRFDSMEAARAYVTKRISGARKRDAKKFAA
jgi:hypothetical protein